MTGVSVRGAIFRFMLRRAFVRRFLLQLLALYCVVGILAARSHHYFDDIAGLRTIVSALLAVLLWPLVLVGVDLRLT
jgi:hypothetical protein